MSDLGPLDGFAREAPSRVVSPDFDQLARLSRRRRRGIVVATGAAATLAIAISAVGLRGGYADQGAPTGPPHTRTPTTTRTTTSSGAAARAVDSPSAIPLSTAVLPDRPDAMAVVWAAGHGQVALAVTADRFQHRSTLLLSGAYPQVSSAGPDWFFVAEHGSNVLVSPVGAVRLVRTVPTPSALATGEYLVTSLSPPGTLAVDPGTATAHPLTLPAHAHGVYGAGDLIWTIASTSTPDEMTLSTIDWSTDGGRTWSSHELASGRRVHFDRVPSAPATMAVTEVGDVTVSPLKSLVVSTDGGTRWHTFDDGAEYTAAVSWTAALPDGTLLVDALLWTDQRSSEPKQHLGGLMASTGSDWTHFTQVHPQVPAGERQSPLTPGDLAATAMDHGSLVLYAGRDRGEQAGLLMSSDGGHTWTLTPNR